MSGPASACQVDALTTVSFEAHRLPLTISARHHSPAMMIDHTGGEKNTYKIAANSHLGGAHREIVEDVPDFAAATREIVGGPQ
jgi:hypothetical protein